MRDQSTEGRGKMMTDEQIDRENELVLDLYITMQRKAINQMPTPDSKLVAILNAIETCRNEGATGIALALSMMIVFSQYASGEEEQRHIDCLAGNEKVRGIFSALHAIATNPAAPSRN